MMYEPQDHRRDRRRIHDTLVTIGQMAIPFSIFTAIVYLFNYTFVFSYALTFGITPEDIGFERLAALSRSAVWASVMTAALGTLLAVFASLALAMAAMADILDKRKLTRPAGKRFSLDHIFGHGRPATFAHGKERTVVTLLPFGAIAATAGACTATVLGTYFLLRVMRTLFFPDENVYTFQSGWTIFFALILFIAFAALSYLRYLYAFLVVFVMCVSILVGFSFQMGNIWAQFSLSPGCDKLSGELLPIVGLSADKVTLSISGKATIPGELTYLGEGSGGPVLTDDTHLFRVSPEGLVTKSDLPPGAGGKHRLGARCIGF